MLNRREILQGAAATAVAGVAMGQEGLGPYDRPTARFDKERQDQLPAWAFTQPLEIPLVPRPTAVGDFDELTEPGARPFGPIDPVPIGESFHGVALEWGRTPEHWKAFGCDPGKSGMDAWRDKRTHFGTIPSHREGEPGVANWGGFPVKCFKMAIRACSKRLRPDTAFEARLYGYAGVVPGPLLRLRLGQPILVRYENHLETEVSVHLHGGHCPSHSDGFPSFYVLQGMARDYFYPNILPLKHKPGAPNATAAGYVVDQGEGQSTMWYHDHGMDATAYNVSKGLAGMAICLGERELKLIHDKVLPGLGPASCIDPERDGLEVDPVKIAELEHPDHPGYYRREKEPYRNPYDIPIVLQDKVIDLATGQVAYDGTGHNGYLGDTFLLNGVAWPRLEVENRKYRFRLLDGSNARVFRLRILSEQDFFRARGQGIDPAGEDPEDAETVGRRSGRYDEIAAPFLRIGKDSWLWATAVRRRSVLLAMANRADIVVDFKELAGHLKEGETATFYLVDTMPQADGRGPKVKLDDPGDPRVLPLPFDTAADPERGIPATTVAELQRPIGLMKIVVRGAPIAESEDASIREGTALNEHEPIEDDEVRVVREFIFERGKGAWQINGRFYDPTIANATPTLGSAEEWVLRNGGGGWWHPIHIHLESHQLVGYEKDFTADEVVDPRDNPARTILADRKSVLDQIPEVEQRGLHDTQILGPNTVARIRMRFRTWNGPFVFHCHNLEHEDMRMMFNFEPVSRDGSDDDEWVEARRLANVAPDARTHGNRLTLHPPGKEPRVGELEWEAPEVPRARVGEAGQPLIEARDKAGL
jgi:FtsP/CotA-like multicopper oxidase with cupredoxin domain